MFVIAHAGRWAIEALELAPLAVAAAVAVWRTSVDSHST